MEQNEKKEKKIKTLTIIFYSAFCFIGLPLIFVFPPRKFLFTEDSESDEDKKYLFKNFVSEIYNNINMKLIDDITLTKQNEKCKSGYEVLNIEHQYYGNFSRFFGNSTFCIKRNNDDEKTFRTILENNKLQCESGKKPCGYVNKISQTLLCVNENDKCPFNFIEFTSKKADNSFQIGEESIYFNPQYIENINISLIIDIDIVYKYRICLERYHKLETPECEFYDNDLCYIEDNINVNRERSLEISSNNYQLAPEILSKFNIENDDSLEHNYCKNPNDKRFKIFSKGYVNFEKKDLDNFLEEFPNSTQNNPFLDVLDLYKSDKNYETLFYYFCFILFIWSFLQLILLILIFFVKNNDILELSKKIYLWNGLALFIFKLICFTILLVSHYSFYLKFKAVYLSLENDPRDEILNSYKNLRIIFITKIFILWIVGFITICMELIILCFIKTFIKLQNEYINEPIYKQIDKPKPSEPVKLSDNFHNSFQNKENLEKHEKNNDKEMMTNNPSIDNEIKQDNSQKYKIPENSPPPSAYQNIQVNNPFNKIELNFQLTEKESNIIKNYKIKVEPNEKFSDIENKLKSQYPELDKKKLDIFILDSQIINKNNAVSEYDIDKKANIVINDN